MEGVHEGEALEGFQGRGGEPLSGSVGLASPPRPSFTSAHSLARPGPQLRSAPLATSPGHWQGCGCKGARA